MQKINIKQNKISSKQNIRAFAMMESLVAISILLTTIVAPLTLSIQSLKYTKLANDRTLASYIASQTVELANNYRQELRLVCTNDLAGTITNCAGDPSKSSLQIFINSFGGSYDMTGLPANTVKNLSCSLYQNPTSKEYTCEAATSSVANIKTVYKRALVVNGNDSFNYAGGAPGYNINAKVISIICYGKALTCDENTKDSVKVYSYIY
jgi:hypothetical protein